MPNWNIKNVKTLSGTFSHYRKIINLNFLKNWKVDNIEYVNELFEECYSLKVLKALKNLNNKN